MKTLLIVVYLTATGVGGMSSQVTSAAECDAVKKALEFGASSPYRVRCTPMRP